MLLLLLLSSASIDEVVATSAAGNLLLPAVITFVGGVPLSFLVPVLSSPVSSCLVALLKLPLVGFSGDFESTTAAGSAFEGGSTALSSDVEFVACPYCAVSDGGCAGW